MSGMAAVNNGMTLGRTLWLVIHLHCDGQLPLVQRGEDGWTSLQEAQAPHSFPSLSSASESKAGATGESGVNPTAYYSPISTSRPFHLGEARPRD